MPVIGWNLGYLKKLYNENHFYSYQFGSSSERVMPAVKADIQFHWWFKEFFKGEKFLRPKIIIVCIWSISTLPAQTLAPPHLAVYFPRPTTCIFKHSAMLPRVFEIIVTIVGVLSFYVFNN